MSVGHIALKLFYENLRNAFFVGCSFKPKLNGLKIIIADNPCRRKPVQDEFQVVVQIAASFILEVEEQRYNSLFERLARFGNATEIDLFQPLCFGVSI